MADEGKPPAGRGAGGGRGGQRKSKFAPTVPSQRRRRTDEAGSSAGPSAAAAAAANDQFRDLIQAAQSESKWQRGRGRGFGRGRGTGVTQVMFGGDGNDMRHTAVVPQLRAPPPKKEGKRAVKTEGDSGTSSRRRLKPNVKPDSKGAAGADSSVGGDEYGGGSGSDGGGGQDPADLFDFEQHFPTTLPLSLHHPCDEEADAAADAAVMRQGLPEELALKEDDPEGATAAQLGLTDLSTAQDTLYLFQLPALLPLGLPPPADTRKGRAGGSSAAPLRAAAARELPSGPVGKLLVFKSGRVKLQMGSCLLDVSTGMPCVSRQDVAAINKTTGHLIQLGPVTQRAVVCPDVWQLMRNQEVPQFRRDLQQQQQLELRWRQPQQQQQPPPGGAAAAAAAVNGVGGGENGAMDIDDDLEDVVGLGGVRVNKQQQKHKVLGSDGESEEGGDGSNGQQQQQQQQQRQRRRAAQQIGSSSEDEADGAAAEAAEVKEQEEASATAAAAAVKQQQLPPQPQQQQPLGWLELPTAPAARGVAGRGRGKFRPSTRSPSPAAAAIPPAAAAAAGGGSLKQEDGMDVDS